VPLLTCFFGAFGRANAASRQQRKESRSDPLK
jgi:hypothetical protein